MAFHGPVRVKSPRPFFFFFFCSIPALAALVIKFGCLQQWAPKWEWSTLNLSSSIHYHDNWQTVQRIIQIHADLLNLNKVERQSVSGFAEQFSLLGFVPLEQVQAVSDWHNTHWPNCYWLFCPLILTIYPGLILFLSVSVLSLSHYTT